MNDDSYHMSVWTGNGIGISIRISIGKIFTSVFGIKSIQNVVLVHLYYTLNQSLYHQASE